MRGYRYRLTGVVISFLFGVNVAGLIADSTGKPNPELVLNHIAVIALSAVFLGLIWSLWTDALMVAKMKKEYEERQKRQTGTWC